MFGYTIKRFIVNWISTLALVARDAFAKELGRVA